MQYTYWPISQEVKAIRLSNLFSSQNVVEKYYSHFKKSKSSISLNQYSKVLYILFFFCFTSWGLSKLIETKLQITYIPQKSFLKNKKRSGTSLPALFSAWFLKKIFSLVMSFYLTKFQCFVAFTSWDIGKYVYCNFLLTRLWRNKI